MLPGAGRWSRSGLTGRELSDLGPGLAGAETSVPSSFGLHLITTWPGQGPCAWCRQSRGEELAMGIRLRHQDPVTPGAAAVPGGRTPRGARLARALRTRWWPRFTLAGAVLVVIGVTVLSGTAQAWVALLGITIFLFASMIGLGVHDRDPVRAQEGRLWMTLLRSSEIGSRREPPVPPGENGPG